MNCRVLKRNATFEIAKFNVIFSFLIHFFNNLMNWLRFNFRRMIRQIVKKILKFANFINIKLTLLIREIEIFWFFFFVSMKYANIIDWTFAIIFDFCVFNLFKNNVKNSKFKLQTMRIEFRQIFKNSNQANSKHQIDHTMRWSILFF